MAHLLKKEKIDLRKYILKRVILLIPVILGVTVLVFTIMYFTPGDPVTTILGSEATEMEKEALREELGLNRGYLARLGSYIYNMFIKFDLGKSYITNVPVMTEILNRLPYTLLLATLSIVFGLLIGVPIGINAAIHRNTVADWGVMAVSMISLSMPGFWLALMLVLIFAYNLKLLPPYGLGGITYWILPIISNSLNGIATFGRQTRSSMLEVLSSDYIVMAQSKGIPRKDVIYKHALPNALIPIITQAGTNFGMLLGGGMVIETVFSIPGVGYYLVMAVSNRDYNVVMGGTLLLAISFSIIMLLTDLALAAVDPRIKAQFASKNGRSHRNAGNNK